MPGAHYDFSYNHGQELMTAAGGAYWQVPGVHYEVSFGERSEGAVTDTENTAHLQ